MHKVYMCDAHGAGTGEACCNQAEETAWYDERVDTTVELDTATLEDTLESKQGTYKS